MARRGAKPAPGPVSKSDPRRVLVDVEHDDVQVLVVLDHARVEAALEEMADAVVTTVEPHCVQAVEALHAGGQVGLCRLDEEMEVVVENDPDMDRPGEPPLDVRE
jgi:hypothetical protein